MSEAERVRKVAAVLVRDGSVGLEVLVFEHPQPDGGTHRQLPAGTVEPGEAPEAAAVRELIEETGVLGAVEALAGVIDEEFEGEARRRWVYVMRSLEDGLDEWPYECDCGAAVRCAWVPLEASVHPGQQAWLDVGRAWLTRG